MLVIIRSAPDTTEGVRGIKLAREMTADIVLLQNGTYFMQGDKLNDSGFAGTTYILSEDRKLRGLKEIESVSKMREITFDDLVDLMVDSENVIGMF